SCEAAGPLVEDQEKFDRDGSRVFQQIRAVIRLHRNFAQRHPPLEARNLVGLELIGAYGNVGGFGKRQSPFGIGTTQEILEPLLGEQSFLWIGLGPHEVIIIRTKGCANGIRAQGARSAQEAEKCGKKEGPFHWSEFFKCSVFWCAGRAKLSLHY